MNLFNIVVLISSLATAFATVSYTILTRNILIQQQKEEDIKYKPYLSINDLKLEKKNNDLAQPLKLSFFCKNCGVTPAYNVNISCELYFNNDFLGVEQMDDKSNTIIMPGSDVIFHHSINANIAKAVIESKDNPGIILRLNYDTYNNKKVGYEYFATLLFDRINQSYSYKPLSYRQSL